MRHRKIARVSAMMMACSLIVLALAFVGSSHARAGETKYKLGDKIANFTLKDDRGASVSLSQYKGKIIILNFYASW